MSRLPLVMLLAASACTPMGEPTDCDPLDPSRCALPWPSQLFTEEADTPTGLQVKLGATTLPVDDAGNSIDPADWNAKDGFSTVGPMMAFLGDVDPASLVPVTDIGASLLDGASSILLDLETGEKVPHWVEVDALSEPGQQLLLMRPALPLRHGARYAVAFRNVRLNSGGPAEPSEGFELLRSGKRTELADVASRQDRFDDDVFPALAEAGFERDTLQLAWDFPTVSRATSLGPSFAMRDDALTRVADAPAVTIIDVGDVDCSVEGTHVGRRIRGSVSVPLYLDSTEAGGRLVLDEAGLPVFQGMTDVAFTVRIPCSVLTGGKSATTYQFGHGLFTSQDEILQDWHAEMLHEQELVVFATDWWGMARGDLTTVAGIIDEDRSDFGTIPDRLRQSHVNAHIMRVAARTTLLDEPSMQADGVPFIDAEDIHFYGISMGTVIGSAYVAQSTELERAAMSVPGAPFSLLLPRSVNFTPFLDILREDFSDERDPLLLVGAYQMLWEPSEGAGWLNELASPPEGTRKKTLLLQPGLHDSQVSPLAAHMIARAVGAHSIEPAVRGIWGIEEAPGGTSGSAIMEFAYTDVPEVTPEAAPPPREFDTHQCPRREQRGQDQIGTFFRTGAIEAVCGEEGCFGERAQVCP